jgi:FkbM family methyltransferase
VGTNGRVLAIEPSSREYNRLLANLALNPKMRITSVRAALGREQGETVLAVAEPGHEGQNTIGQSVSNPKVATMAHETVPMLTLDRLVEGQDLERLDILKLDIEGSEVEALLGGTRTIERLRPLIQIEAEPERLASQGRTKDDVRRVLAELDYELFVFDAHDGLLRPAKARDEPECNALAAPRGWQPPR